MRKILYVVGLIILVIAVRLCCYTVDAAEYVYVTVLGRHVATCDGARHQSDAGLHLGWPWPIRLVQRLDRRLQQFDLPSTELLTHDPEGKTIDKTLAVEGYVCWRIADADKVDKFIRRLGNAERAREILRQRINSQFGAALGQMPMDDLISTRPGTMPGQKHVDEKMAALQGKLMQDLQGPVLEEYGLQLVDIRLRRFNHPAQVRPAIFERIRSERQIKVAKYRSDGEKQAKDIETAALEKERDLLARARYQEEKLKGDADTEAVRIRNDAHSQDPEYYAFLKQMEKLHSILADNKTVLLLSSQRPIFDLLFHPPRPNGVVTVPAKKGPAPKGPGQGP